MFKSYPTLLLLVLLFTSCEEKKQDCSALSELQRLGYKGKIHTKTEVSGDARLRYGKWGLADSTTYLLFTERFDTNGNGIEAENMQYRYGNWTKYHSDYKYQKGKVIINTTGSGKWLLTDTTTWHGKSLMGRVQYFTNGIPHKILGMMANTYDVECNLYKMETFLFDTTSKEHKLAKHEVFQPQRDKHTLEMQRLHKTLFAYYMSPYIKILSEDSLSNPLVILDSTSAAQPRITVNSYTYY